MHSEGRNFLEDILSRELAEIRVSPQDRGLIQELCFGTVRWRATLDWLIDSRSADRPPAPPARVLLRLGLYQLFWLDRIPDHAAVNETVESARTLGFERLAGYINAILRNYTRADAETRANLLRLRTEDPALGWSHPAWLVDRWKTHRTPESLQSLLAWNNAAAPTYARVNTLKSDAAQLIEAWRTEGVEYDFKTWDWTGLNLVFHLRNHPPLDKLRSFRSGWFYIQDPSTLVAPKLLQPVAGERILDMCAAPGGKTTYIAQLLDNDGCIIATDPDTTRRERLRQNCERLGADVQALSPDDPEVATGRFDAILVDAPCSNTGVLRRRLDVRWRLQPADLERTCALQKRLLETAAARVRDGGRIVYSTCSIEPDENEGVVDPFLKNHSRFTLDAVRHLDPVKDGVDGAFVALLRAG